MGSYPPLFCVLIWCVMINNFITANEENDKELNEELIRLMDLENSFHGLSQKLQGILDGSSDIAAALR